MVFTTYLEMYEHINSSANFKITLIDTCKNAKLLSYTIPSFVNLFTGYDIVETVIDNIVP
jgi:hypothetical protein